jgi:hypothetical protein
MLLCATEIRVSSLGEGSVLSPKNYATINIHNPNKSFLRDFLNVEDPFTSGSEPGSFSYVPQSNVSFIRNSCIDSLNWSNQTDKEIFLNPKYGYATKLARNDILLCKDANIGDSCLFIPREGREYAISSGVVRLNFLDEQYKYYCLAFLRDNYFINQLDAKTPKGSTIRHAGTRFLDCLIPSIGAAEQELLPLIESLTKNMAYAERVSLKKLDAAYSLIKAEFLREKEIHSYPSHSALSVAGRLDAGYYSDIASNIQYSLDQYKNVLQLEQAGFSLKRGPNLQVRDLGRSITSPNYKKNYHVLVYPSDISDSGYILRETFLGARNPVWYMKAGDILFSAEGTVGKMFVICDEKMKFITNIHGLIISPNKDTLHLKDSISLGLYLHFLRRYGYFDMVSVGGQGGSFALNYWDNFMIPDFDPELKDQIANLYHSGAQLAPHIHSLEEMERAGVFELNQFRIECHEILKRIVEDIKTGQTRPYSEYGINIQ